jgi:polysaccharide export outer membrane protein
VKDFTSRTCGRRPAFVGRPLAKSAATALLAIGLANCSAVPGTGPTTDQILNDPNSTVIGQDDSAALRYAVVPVNASVAQLVNAELPTASPSFRPDEPPSPPQLTIRPGDLLTITIVNTSQAGFVDFGEATVSPLATTNLPAQQVGPDGRISVPPLGRFPAAGRTPQTLEAVLESSLGGVLIDPSVIVTLTDRLDGRIAVMGDVPSPGSFPILSDDTRLLDIIGAAGGPSSPAEEVDLLLIRDGRESRIRFDRFLERADWNIVAWPGDVLRLEPHTRNFVVLGAAGVNNEYEFVEPTLTLAQALGRSRGLVNTQAARHGIFIFRPTLTSTLQQLSTTPVSFDDPVVPTVYHFDFREPLVLFAAQRFELADGDMIYIPDSPVTELSKLLSIFTQSLSTGATGRNFFIVND